MATGISISNRGSVAMASRAWRRRKRQRIAAAHHRVALFRHLVAQERRNIKSENRQSEKNGETATSSKIKSWQRVGIGADQRQPAKTKGRRQSNKRHHQLSLAHRWRKRQRRMALAAPLRAKNNGAHQQIWRKRAAARKIERSASRCGIAQHLATRGKRYQQLTISVALNGRGAHGVTLMAASKTSAKRQRRRQEENCITGYEEKKMKREGEAAAAACNQEG